MARPRSDIKPRLLHAARHRFLAEGVDGASLRDIARDAKTNVGMVVYYFPSKDELFLAVVLEVYEKLLADATTALRGPGTTRERLGRAFVRIGSASDDELDVIRLVVREALLVPPSPRFARLLARFREGHLGRLLETLHEGQTRGEIDGDLPLPMLLVSTLGMGGLPQILRRVVGGALPFASLPAPEALAERSLAALFDGIGPKAKVRAKTRTKAPRR